MKYEIILEKENTKYISGCPIQIVKYSISKGKNEGLYFATLYFTNHINKKIRNVQVNLLPSQNNGQPISFSFNAETSDLNFSNKVPFAFTCDDIKKIEFTVTQVEFDTNQNWDVSKKNTYQTHESTPMGKFEKYLDIIKKRDKYQLEFKNYFVENNNNWKCSCGQTNKGDICTSCSIPKSYIKELFDLSSLETEWQKIEKQKKEESENKKNKLNKELDTKLHNAENQSEIDIKSKNLMQFAKGYQTLNSLSKCSNIEISNRAKENLILHEHGYENLENLIKENEIKTKAKAKRKVISIISTITIAICIITAIGISSHHNNVVVPREKYAEAITAYNSCDYDKSIEIFQSLGDYEDSAEKIIECKYAIGVEYINSNDYLNARYTFMEVYAFEDSANYVKSTYKMEAEDLMQNGNYNEAVEIFTDISDMDGVAILIDECRYNIAIELKLQNKIDDALAMFSITNNYGDSSIQIMNLRTRKAKEYYQDCDYKNAIIHADGTATQEACKILEDAVIKYENSAMQNYNKKQYDEAKEKYDFLAPYYKHLNYSAQKRATYYPIYIQAWTSQDNFDEVLDALSKDMTAKHVIEDIDNYFKSYLTSRPWLYMGDTSLYIVFGDTIKTNIPDVSIPKTEATYSSGYVKVYGMHHIEVDIHNETSATFTINDIEYDCYR